MDSPHPRFDPPLYHAALAYYSLPMDTRRVFVKVDARTLACGTAADAARRNLPAWVQVNEPAAGFPLRKAANADIAVVRTITLDAEYAPEPHRAHAIGLELAQDLEQAGLVAPGLAVEDSGAGCHLVLPIPPIRTADHGGGDSVNAAVALVVATDIKPRFAQAAERHGLAGQIKLEAFDISRLFSVPGMWRPGGLKPDEAAYLRDGYVRRWLPPYTAENPPRRRESHELARRIIAATRLVQTENKAQDEPTWRQAPVPLDLRKRAAQGRIKRVTLDLLDEAGPAGYQSASEADAALAAGLISAGLTTGEAYVLLLGSVRGDDALKRKGERHGETYLKRTVAHAAGFVGPVVERPTGLRVRYSTPAQSRQALVREGRR